MEHLLEILKIAEAGLQSDRTKAAAYIRQLADKLEGAGEPKAAERLRRVLTATNGALVTAAGATIHNRLPVDSESRLDLADETEIRSGETEVFLPIATVAVVDEFILYVSSADKLLDAGIGISPSLLMYGPPGCGKTELARSIAVRLSLPLVTARIDALISSYLGSTAKNLRLLFDHAASRPCVLFLDEFDAVAKLRDDQHELGELKRVVVSLLQNIDAAAGSTVILAATNHEHLLDAAVWRRFAYHVHIHLPDSDTRIALYRKFLQNGVPEQAVCKLAEVSEGFSGSDIREICESARRGAILKSGPHDFVADLLKRILLRKLGAEGLPNSELIARAKAINPRIYTHRVLAAALGMTPGNVTHIIRRAQCDENKTQSAT